MSKKISKGKKNNIEIKDYEAIIRFIFWMFTAIYGAACFYLYYNQAMQPLDYDNRYFQSDLPYHISMVIDDGWYYSFTALIYIVLYKLAGGDTVCIALFLMLVSIVTVLITERLLRALGLDNVGVSCSGAIMLNMLMPFYVRDAGAYRYVSYQSGNVWHNSTYQCMKLGALACMLLYVEYEKRYKLKMHNGWAINPKYDKSKYGLGAKELVCFAGVLALTTFIKPSFLTVFAPAFAIKLLFDLIRKKAKFINALLFGITVIPSCLVMLWQNSILFGEETNNGFKISLFETFSLHANRPKVTVILSLAFPIVVFICQLITFIREKEKLEHDYIFSIIMAIVGFAEAALLVETGARSRDGNFLWGYAFGLAWLYMTSFKKWYELVKKKKWVMVAITSAVLAYQFICGAYFFVRLMFGETYFMQ